MQCTNHSWKIIKNVEEKEMSELYALGPQSFFRRTSDCTFKLQIIERFARKVYTRVKSMLCLKSIFSEENLIEVHKICSSSS